VGFDCLKAISCWQSPPESLIRIGDILARHPTVLLGLINPILRATSSVGAVSGGSSGRARSIQFPLGNQVMDACASRLRAHADGFRQASQLRNFHLTNMSFLKAIVHISWTVDICILLVTR